MTVFNLPSQTIVNKVIPKNAFDKHTNTRQKKRLAEFVERIRWTNKLSSETINLSGKDILEIQVFEIQLRKHEDIDDLLDAFDKAIPYPAVFLVFFNDKAYVSSSKKHLHPIHENLSVIDWRFKTKWQKKPTVELDFDLKKSLDHVFLDICNKLSSGLSKANSLDDLVVFEQELTRMRISIEKLKAAIKRTTQFNRKVELNQELKKLEFRLYHIKNSA